MADQYGSDFITITDEDGAEYELEVLLILEYNGTNYIAAIPVSEELNPEVLVFRSEEDDGDPILCAIEDEDELEAVNNLIMDSLYQDSEEQ